VLATRKGKKWRWGKRAGSDALDAFKATRWGSIGGGLVWGTRWMRRRGGLAARHTVEEGTWPAVEPGRGSAGLGSAQQRI
jgi:hypothetical protein